MLSPILALFARISKPLSQLRQRPNASVNYRVIYRIIYRCSLTYYFLFVSISRFMSDENRVSMVPKYQDQDRDRDSGVLRPRPRPRLWGFKTKTKTKTPRFKTKTETKTCKNGSRDVSRPRLKSRELSSLGSVQNILFQLDTIFWPNLTNAAVALSLCQGRI